MLQQKKEKNQINTKISSGGRGGKAGAVSAQNHQPLSHSTLLTQIQIFSLNSTNTKIQKYKYLNYSTIKAAECKCKCIKEPTPRPSIWANAG